MAKQITEQPEGGPPSEQPARQARNEPLIVGVGASAGGLEAFKSFISHIPEDSGMAFILVQHLSPDQNSMLVELLAPHTSLPVIVAADKAGLKADHIYVLPPNATLTVVDGLLRLERPAPPRGKRQPIDALFESLAREQGENTAAVVLSGTGSDGTRGLKMVKEYGGLTLAQAGDDHVPLSGMPESATASGQVDDVLPAESIPERLGAYCRHLSQAAEHKGDDGERRDVADHLDAICRLLREHTGHDFSEYKDNTRIRRIQRRMQVRQINDASAYVDMLPHDTGELGALFQEMLVGVTRFFRDPDTWEALDEQVIEPLVNQKGATDTIRVWCVGVGSGEEAYTTAILFHEALEAKDSARPGLQVFATDIDADAINTARAGWYGPTMAGLDAERSRRWFTEDQGGYRPNRAIRDSCIFSLHDIDRDPPFSHLDLVVCRNLLIYMSTALQARVLRKCHYALRPGGTLFLGSSESASSHADLFEAVDARNRLLCRNSDVTTSSVGYLNGPGTSAPPPEPQPETENDNQHKLESQIRRVMAPYSPAYMVIDRHHTIQHFSGGPAGAYLEPSDGVASFNLFALIKKTLRSTVRSAVARALADNQTVVHDDISLLVEGRPRHVQTIVAPLVTSEKAPNQFVVAFRDTGPAHDDVLPESEEYTPAGDAALEHELAVTRNQLQAALTELETTREEAKSATEEYQSVNEELQSSNEELETSKEEMQSVNEELQTINTELDNKNQRLERLNSDLRNLLESTHVATLFLDDELRIKNYTPAALNLFHLRDSDYGRPITELVSNLAYDDLPADVATVLNQLTTVEREVQSTDGATYIMNIRLYRTVNNVIDGVVITFFDISERKRYELQSAWLATVVEASPDAIISEDLKGRVTSWNPAAERLFDCSAEDAIGQPLESLFSDDAATALPDRHVRQRQVRPVEIEHTQRDGTPISARLTFAAIADEQNRRYATALIAHDVTARVEEEQRRRLLVRELSHRVKNVLATVQSVMTQTAAYSDSLAGFRETFSQRLQALANTHTELLRSDWQGVHFETLVKTSLDPYGDQTDPPWTLSGPGIDLAPTQAIAMAMALHELATNAAKYGALSTNHGHVAVDWAVQSAADNSDGEAGNEVAFRWREQDGPAVTPPAKHNFGTQLIQEGLAHELDARVTMDFEPEGLQCDITFPYIDPSQTRGAKLNHA